MEIKTKRGFQDPVFSYRNKIVRVTWAFFYYFLFRFSPTPMFGFRRFLLRLFGAKIGAKANVYPSVEIWLPSNLELADYATLGRGVKIYNQGFIKIGEQAIVSQGAYLCASTHDYNNPMHPLILAPILIDKKAWICTDAFVGPGLTVCEGAIIGARAVLTKPANAWGVYAGNPARIIKERDVF